MHPADQRFEPHHLAGPQIDLRLVMEAQLVLLYGLSQFRLQPQPIDRVLVQRFIEQHVTAATLLLGVRQCDVGAADQVAWLHDPLAAH